MPDGPLGGHASTGIEIRAGRSDGRPPPRQRAIAVQLRTGRDGLLSRRVPTIWLHR
jgi:hypothetical protein